MEKIFSMINGTINKSAVVEFREFIKKYSNVTKWYVCSDYCFGDDSKPNDVVSFVIYPHDIDIGLKQDYIQSLQMKDLKKTRSINPDFCRFLHSGTFFSFNFILEKINYFNSWNNKDLQQHFVDTCIETVNQWKDTTPKNSELYIEYAGRLRRFKNNMGSKSFNCALMARMLSVAFLAGYIKYLLLQEHKNLDLYSWLPDRDAITEWQDGICEIFYHIMSHELCTRHLTDPKIESKMEEIYFEANKTEQFYDQLNRVADYICGTLADYDYNNGIVTAEKQCILVEDAIADNSYIINISIADKETKRIEHKRGIDTSQ